MKKHFIRCLTALLLLLTIFCVAQKTEKLAIKQSFFTESDASNWIYILNDKSLNPLDVFKMKDGVLEITGASSGYLRTKKVYENCDINLEWR
jgi:hypothetical protein